MCVCVHTTRSGGARVCMHTTRSGGARVCVCVVATYHYLTTARTDKGSMNNSTGKSPTRLRASWDFAGGSGGKGAKTPLSSTMFLGCCAFSSVPDLNKHTRRTHTHTHALAPPGTHTRAPPGRVVGTDSRASLCSQLPIANPEAAIRLHACVCALASVRGSSIVPWSIRDAGGPLLHHILGLACDHPGPDPEEAAGRQQCGKGH